MEICFHKAAVKETTVCSLKTLYGKTSNNYISLDTLYVGTHMPTINAIYFLPLKHTTTCFLLILVSFHIKYLITNWIMRLRVSFIQELNNNKLSKYTLIFMETSKEVSSESGLGIYSTTIFSAASECWISHLYLKQKFISH